MIEMRLHDVLVRVVEDDETKQVVEQRIVMLEEVEGDRLLAEFDSRSSQATESVVGLALRV